MLIELRTSKLLALYVAAAHALALSALAFADLPPSAQVPIALALAVSLAHAWWHAILRRAPSSVVALQPRPDGALVLTLRKGARVQARVLPQSTALSKLVVILARGEAPASRHAVVLTPGSVRPDELRALRVWLRWRSHAPGDA